MKNKSTAINVDDIDVKILLAVFERECILNRLPLRLPANIPAEEKTSFFKRLRTEQDIFLRDFYNKHISDKKESPDKKLEAYVIGKKIKGSKTGKNEWTPASIDALARKKGKLPKGSTDGMTKAELKEFKKLRWNYKYGKRPVTKKGKGRGQSSGAELEGD